MLRRIPRSSADNIESLRDDSPPRPARIVRLAECTWVEARALARDRRAVVLLPLGAVEEHGPHLPLLVDWLGAEELARRLAPHLTRAGWRPVLAPSLPYGASPLAERWPGTVSLSEPTLARLIVEIVRGLARHGFRRFVLTNYQADPAHLRAIARARRALARNRVQVLVAGFSPDTDEQAVMLTPRILHLMRSPRPERSGTPARWRPPWSSTRVRTWCAGPSRASCRRAGWDFRAALGAWRAAIRADGPRRTGLFRLARDGAGGHRAPGDGAASATHGEADHGGAWDMPGVRDRVAVVTGAANGLGARDRAGTRARGRESGAGDLDAAGVERVAAEINQSVAAGSPPRGHSAPMTGPGGAAFAMGGDLTEEGPAASAHRGRRRTVGQARHPRQQRGRRPQRQDLGDARGGLGLRVAPEPPQHLPSARARRRRT